MAERAVQERQAAQGGSAPRPLRDFAAAIGFLTLLPVGREWPDGRPPRSVGWYAWVGWLLGAVGVVVGTAPVLVRAILTRVGAAGLAASSAPAAAPQPLVLAAVVVAGWAMLTRFLHWDGLADAFDGLWGGQTRERRLEIMHDSRIGSFGAAALVMTALVQVASVQGILSTARVWPILAAPVLGRFAASLAAWTLPPARRDGLGLTAMEKPGFYDLAVAVAAVAGLAAAVIVVDPVRGAVVLVVGIGAGLLVPRALARPVGGMTGDLMGATVLLVETLVLLTGAVI